MYIGGQSQIIIKREGGGGGGGGYTKKITFKKKKTKKTKVLRHLKIMISKFCPEGDLILMFIRGW